MPPCHLVFNFLVDWNPFLVGSSTSPISQIPSILLEARRITTTVVNRVLVKGTRETLSTSFHSAIPRHRGTSGPDASRESLQSFPAHDVHWWWWHHWRRQNLWLPRCGHYPSKWGWNMLEPGKKWLLPVVPIKIIFGRFSSRKTWLRINQQWRNNYSPFQILAINMLLDGCQLVHATSQYLAINRVAMHLGRVM